MANTRIRISSTIWAGGKTWNQGTYDVDQVDDAILNLAKDNSVKVVVFENAEASEASDNQLDDTTTPINPNGAEGNGEGQDTGSDNGEGATTNEINFMAPEDFEELSSTKQQEYLAQVRVTPEMLNEEEASAYEQELFEMLEAYKEVAKPKAAELIDEIMSEYDSEE